MTRTGMKKHVDVLEQAGFVTTEKVGRVGMCKAGPRDLQEEVAGTETYRQLWGAPALTSWTRVSRNEDGRRESVDERRKSEATPLKSRTAVERTSERDVVVTRTVNGPARLVFAAWTRAELFRKWWVPKSYGLTLLSCEMDVRVGGTYRLVFRHQDSTMEFFGTYREVTQHSRLVWTNEEGDNGETITTVTFDENAGKTLVVVCDHYSSKEALDFGSTGGMPEALDQLNELLASIGSSPATE